VGGVGAGKRGGKLSLGLTVSVTKRVSKILRGQSLILLQRFLATASLAETPASRATALNRGERSGLWREYDARSLFIVSTQAVRSTKKSRLVTCHGICPITSMMKEPRRYMPATAARSSTRTHRGFSRDGSTRIQRACEEDRR
jgi:hypothetical protein